MSNDFLQAARNVEKAQDHLQDSVPDAVESGLERTREAAQLELATKDTVATGDLGLSLRVRETPNAGTANADATFQLSAREPYAAFVEYGTGLLGIGPFPSPSSVPPLQPFLTWVVEKGITPDPTGPYDTQVAVADAIRHAVEATGQKPKPYVRPAWERTKPLLLSDVHRQIRRARRKITMGL